MVKTGVFRIVFLSILLAGLMLSVPLIGSALANLSAQEMNPVFNGFPLEMHADSGGNLWISDYYSEEIWKVDSSGNAYTIYSVGSKGAGPGDAQTDASGNVWFVDNTYLRELDPDPEGLGILSWDIGTRNYTLYGLSLDGSGRIWVTEPGTNYIYRVTLGAAKYDAYLVPDSADFLYPLVSNDQLWLGDAFNHRLLRLDFSTTPTWTYWQLPEDTSPYYLTLDASGNVWYTDDGNKTIGRLAPSGSKLTVYPLLATTSPKWLAVSSGIVWFDGQSTPSIGFLDPTQNTATPQDVTTGTPATSSSQKNFPSPSSLTATTTDGTTTWPSTSYTSLSQGSGWSIFELPGGSQPSGIAVTSKGYVVDTIQSVLIRYSMPTAVTISKFTANSIPQAIQLDWQTAQENDLIGFNLFRADALYGPKVKINPELIPAQHPGQLLGADYQFLDTQVEAGKTYYYWVEWVGISGSDLNGPVIAQLQRYFWLPVIRN